MLQWSFKEVAKLKTIHLYAVFTITHNDFLKTRYLLASTLDYLMDSSNPNPKRHNWFPYKDTWIIFIGLQTLLEYNSKDERISNLELFRGSTGCPLLALPVL